MTARAPISATIHTTQEMFVCFNQGEKMWDLSTVSYDGNAVTVHLQCILDAHCIVTNDKKILYGNSTMMQSHTVEIPYGKSHMGFQQYGNLLGIHVFLNYRG